MEIVSKELSVWFEWNSIDFIVRN